jgi:O-antigen/teichoic acid export membrane protein
MHQFSIKRWLFGPAVLLAVINLGVTVVTLFSGVYIARSLEGQQYGQYAYMANVFLLLTLFCGFGLTGQAAKDVAEHQLVADPAFEKRFSGLVALRMATALGAAAVGCVFFIIDRNAVYLYASIGASLFMCSDFIVGVLSGYKRYKSIAPLIAVQPGVFAASLFIRGVSRVDDIYIFFLISQLSSVALGLALSMSSVRFKLDVRSIRHLTWRKMVAGQIYLIILLQVAYGSYGIALAGGLKQYDAAGELSIALTIVRLLPLLVGTLMSVLYFPQLSALYQSGATQIFRTKALRLFMVTSIVAAGCVVVLFAIASTAVPIIYTARHSAAIPLVQILAMTMFFGVADQVITWVLVASNQAWKALLPLVIRMIVMVFTWPLAVLSIPIALPQLIALGYVVSSCIGWLMQIYYQRRVLIWPRSVEEAGKSDMNEIGWITTEPSTDADLAETAIIHS